MRRQWRPAANSIAHVEEVATKADIHRLEINLTRLIFGVAFSTTVVIIGAVGLMIKFIPLA